LEIQYKRYSIIILDYKGRSDESRIILIPHHLTLNNLSPVYKGRIKFELINEKLRPEKFFLKINQKQKNFPSKEFKKLIKIIDKIILPTNLSPKFKDKIKDMLIDFQINKNKIIETEICQFCYFNDRFTELKKNEYHLLDKIICFNCAKKELLRELEFRGLKGKTKIANYLEKLLFKIKNVEKVINFIFSQKTEFNPEISLYDKIPASTLDKTKDIEDIDIPKILKLSLKNRGITNLLPAQELSIEKGLLDSKNLLIVSATSGGKTLLGELAGIKKLIEKKQKLLFLVPLVALANQLYNDFKQRYNPLGLKVAIKVGMPQIDVGEDELIIVDDDITNADIIIATYEGFDIVLRSDFGSAPRNIGTIVIDEIQMLSDEDRGYELEGLFIRLGLNYPNSQFICLSATIGNPEEIATKFNLKLVHYLGRPVPLERHLILTLNENDKLTSIANLIKLESDYISKDGFKGQSIIFTNSRRKTEEIADFLKKSNIKAVPYHAGMTYSKRKKIEESYISGIYKAIVTTFALGAGFDAPVSQVIFESLMMGKDYLSINMFNQMLGRAGRLGKHDRGKVVLLIEIGKKVWGSAEQTEDQVAINLLEGKIEPVFTMKGFDEQAEQILAIISVFNELDIDNLVSSLRNTVYEGLDLSSLLNFLSKSGFIKLNKKRVVITELGKNIATTYLKLDQAKFVLDNLGSKTFQEIAILLEPFESVYLSSRVIAELKNIFRTYFPTRFFSSSLMGSIDSKDSKLYKKLPKWLIDIFTNWLNQIFNCSCKDNPYCECGKISLSKKIIEFREMGLNPRNISSQLLELYDLYVYPGDIFNWLESLIYNLMGVKKIAKLLKKIDIVNQINETITNIQQPI
jgi:helicase